MLSDVFLGGVIIWRVLNHYSERALGAFFVGRGMGNTPRLTRE